MKQRKDRVNKTVTLSLLFGAQLFSYMIRYALSIVAPTLMNLYHLSPQPIFYCIGGASLLLTLAWFGYYPNKSVGRQSGGKGLAKRQRIPWLFLFRYRSTWGIAFGQMGYLYAYFFFVSRLPGYLVLERKMTL